MNADSYLAYRAARPRRRQSPYQGFANAANFQTRAVVPDATTPIATSGSNRCFHQLARDTTALLPSFASFTMGLRADAAGA